MAAPLGSCKEGDIPRAHAVHPYRLYRAVRPRPAAMKKEEQERDEGHAAALGAGNEHLVGAHLFYSTAFVTIEGSELEGRGVFYIDYEVFREGESLKVGTEVVRCKLASDIDVKVEVAGYAAPDIKLPQWDVRLTAGTGEIVRSVEDLDHEFELRYGV